MLEKKIPDSAQHTIEVIAKAYFPLEYQNDAVLKGEKYFLENYFDNEKLDEYKSELCAINKTVTELLKYSHSVKVQGYNEIDWDFSHECK